MRPARSLIASNVEVTESWSLLCWYLGAEDRSPVLNLSNGSTSSLTGPCVISLLVVAFYGLLQHGKLMVSMSKLFDQAANNLLATISAAIVIQEPSCLAVFLLSS